MATPEPKADGIKNFLDNMFDRTNKIENNKCVSCGGDAIEFDDEESRREYKLSGMCQHCQNEFFTS